MPLTLNFLNRHCNSSFLLYHCVCILSRRLIYKTSVQSFPICFQLCARLFPLVQELLITYCVLFCRIFSTSPICKIGHRRPRLATSSIAVSASTALLGFFASGGVMLVIRCLFLLLYSDRTFGIKSDH
jgi:hypothetical protein